MTFEEYMNSIGIEETRVVEGDLVSVTVLKELWDKKEKENQKLKDQLEEMRYYIPHIDKTVMDGKKEIKKLREAYEVLKDASSLARSRSGNPNPVYACHLISKELGEALKKAESILNKNSESNSEK